jgi:hypothetical protein
VSFVQGAVVDLGNRIAVITTGDAPRADHAGKNADSRQKRLTVRFEVCIWAGGTHYAPPIRPDPETSYASLLARRKELDSGLEQLQKARQYVPRRRLEHCATTDIP